VLHYLNKMNCLLLVSVLALVGVIAAMVPKPPGTPAEPDAEAKEPKEHHPGHLHDDKPDAKGIYIRKQGKDATGGGEEWELTKEELKRDGENLITPELLAFASKQENKGRHILVQQAVGFHYMSAVEIVDEDGDGPLKPEIVSDIIWQTFNSEFEEEHFTGHVDTNLNNLEKLIKGLEEAGDPSLAVEAKSVMHTLKEGSKPAAEALKSELEGIRGELQAKFKEFKAAKGLAAQQEVKHELFDLIHKVNEKARTFRKAHVEHKHAAKAEVEAEEGVLKTQVEAGNGERETSPVAASPPRT